MAELVKHQYLVNQAYMKVRRIVLLNESPIGLFDGKNAFLQKLLVIYRGIWKIAKNGETDIIPR